MTDYPLILSTNYIGKQWVSEGTDYTGITWLDESPKPTQAELDALWQSTKAYVSSQAYIAKRQAEYPPITDYLDGIVKGDQDQVDKYIADCLAVKAKYPK